MGNRLGAFGAAVIIALLAAAITFMLPGAFSPRARKARDLPQHSPPAPIRPRGRKISRRIPILAAAAILAVAAAAGALFLPGALTSRAVQDAHISFDMPTAATGGPTDNTYND